MRATKKTLLGTLILPFLLSCVAEDPQNPDFSSRESDDSFVAVSDASDSMESSEKDYSSCDFSVLAASFPLHAVNNNAMQSVKIERNVLFVFINNCSLK